MYAKLFSKSGVFRGRSFVLSCESRIGRKKDNEIRLPAGTISSHHARIFPDEEGNSFLIEDLGSLNGTSVDGVPVRGIEKLGPLHVITFAENADFIFRTVQGSAPEVERETGAAEGRPEHDTAVDTGAPVLVDVPVFAETSEKKMHQTNVGLDLAPVPKFSDAVGSVPVPVPDPVPDPDPDPDPGDEAPVPLELVVRHAGRSDRLQIGENLVGRIEEAAIRIDDGSVSRRHALLLWDGELLRVRDLGSSNGTFVDGQEVSGEQALELPATVRFGTRDLRIEVPTDD